MHDGTKIAAHAGRGSFRHEEQIQKHLEAARNRVAAMGDPRRDMDEDHPVRAIWELSTVRSNFDWGQCSG